MNFTFEIKKEIMHRGLGVSTDTLTAKKAGLSAFIRTSGALGVREQTPTFFVVSQTEKVAEFFMQIFAEVFDSGLVVTYAAQDKLSGRDKLVMQCVPNQSVRVLTTLGLLKRNQDDFREGILPSLVKNENEKIAYIQGAFLGGGSCLLPGEHGGGYHLEIVFSEKKVARDFCRLLADFELLARVIERKESFVVYMKSKEVISDFLSIIGVEHALKKFTAFLDKREEANYDNRAKNCMAGNADKSAIAAVKQVVALQKMQSEVGFDLLSEELRVLAWTRLKHTTMSLQELANYLGESKSCINHRMRKLMEIAGESTRETKQKK